MSISMPTHTLHTQTHTHTHMAQKKSCSVYKIHRNMFHLINVCTVFWLHLAHWSDNM